MKFTTYQLAVLMITGFSAIVITISERIGYNISEEFTKNITSEKGVVSVEVELGIVCDKEFSEMFGFNEKNIYQYCNKLIRDVNVFFQTLTFSRITFKITSFMIIKDTADQPFMKRTNVRSVQDDFGKWVYLTSFANETDLILIISAGTEQLFSRSTFHESSVCIRNDSERSNKNVVVYNRSYFSTYDLYYSLGSTLAAKKSCDIPKHPPVQYSAFFFSICWEISIMKHLRSPQASCLHITNARSISIYAELEGTMDTPSLLADQCKMKDRMNEKYLKNSDTFDCLRTRCIFDTELLQHQKIIYPLYDTPCNNEGICFRGSCVPKGFVLESSSKELCLFCGHASFNGEDLTLRECSPNPYRFDKIAPIFIRRTGYSLTAFNKDVLKCISHDPSNRILFDECASNNSTMYIWEILELADGSSDILIRSKINQKFVTLSAKNTLVLSETKPKTTKAAHWKLVDSYIKKPKVLKKIKASITVTLVCDRNCGKVFGYNYTRFISYGRLTLSKFQWDSVDFENFEVSFRVPPGITLWNIGDPDFDARDMQMVHIAFEKWNRQNSFRFAKGILVLLTTTTVKSQCSGIRSIGNGCQYRPTIVTFPIESENQTHCNFLHAVNNTFREMYETQRKRIFRYNNSPIHPMIKEYPFIFLKDPLCLEKYDYVNGIVGENTTELLPILTMNEQCNLRKQDDVLYVPEKEQDCYEVPCVKAGGSSLFVSKIRPLPRTPCGWNKFCFNNICREMGFQLEHVHSSKCLVAKSWFDIDDRVIMVNCSDIFTLFEEFHVIPENNPERHLLASHIFVDHYKQNSKKCLFADQTTPYLSFKQCTGNLSESFYWKFEPVTNDSETFLVVHHELRVCVKRTENGYLYLTVDCNISDASLYWRKRFNKHMQSYSKSYSQLPTVGPLYTSTTVITKAEEPIHSSTTPTTKANEPLYSSTAHTTKAVNENLESGEQHNDVGSTTSKPEFFQNSFLLFALVIMVAVLFLTLISTTCVLFRKRNRNIPQVPKSPQSSAYDALLGEGFYTGFVSGINPEISPAEQADLLPFDRRWEFPRERLLIGHKLGSGAFGSVFKAKALGILQNQTTTTVAVKTISMPANSMNIKALISELKIMCHVGRNINIVNLLGACVSDITATKKMLIIMEYCKYGNLRTFMQNHRKTFINDPGLLVYQQISKELSNVELEKHSYLGQYEKSQIKPLQTQDLFGWSYQIAQGMDYLSSRRVLHGDLAARNVLLADEFVVKICDFGFSRELSSVYNYNYKKCMDNAVVPYKWMAIESLKYGLFSTQSDVWAFGVLLWEIFTLGDTPYPGVQVDEKFVERIAKGYRMEKPLFAPSRLYDIILQCWLDDSSRRPSFSVLSRALGNMLNTQLRDYYKQTSHEFDQQNTCRFGIQNDECLLQTTSTERELAEDSAGYLLPENQNKESQPMTVFLSVAGPSCDV